MPNKRMDILKSCIDVFSKKGYYKATIEDIAIGAGIGKGTVYLYFSGKEELFEEMLKHILCEYLEDLKAILIKDESIESRLTDLIFFYKKNIEGQMDLIKTIISEYDSISSNNKIIFKEKREKLNIVLHEFMEDGIERGEINSEIDKCIASLSIFSIIEHYYLDKIHGDCIEIENIDHAPLLEFILKMLK